MGALNHELRRLSQGNSELTSAVPPTRVRIRSQDPSYTAALCHVTWLRSSALPAADRRLDAAAPRDGPEAAETSQTPPGTSWRSL